MVNVTKTNLFPTSIYEFDAEITEQQRQTMLDYIQDKFENKNIDVKSGEGLPFGLYQGDDDLQTKPEFKPLFLMRKGGSPLKFESTSTALLLSEIDPISAIATAS